MGAFQSAAALGRIGGPIAAGWLYHNAQPGPFLLASTLLVGVAFLARSMPGIDPEPTVSTQPTIGSS
jgi:hypothetical protein